MLAQPDAKIVKKDTIQSVKNAFLQNSLLMFNVSDKIRHPSVFCCTSLVKKIRRLKDYCLVIL